MADRDDGSMPLAGNYTRADGDRIIAQGTAGDLHALRLAVLTSLQHIEAQIADAAAPATKSFESHDWLIRARGAARAYRVWLTRINERLSEINAPRPHEAVHIPAAGRDAKSVVTAINELIAKGCRIHAFNCVGDDLVVVAAAPRAKGSDA